MQQYKKVGFSLPSPVVTILLILNILLYLTAIALNIFYKIDLVGIFGLSYPGTQNFKAWQLITYLFVYGGFSHILFNMIVLWMFGTLLENTWGSKRFLIFYFIAGISTGLVHILMIYLRINSIIPNLSDNQISLLYNTQLIGAFGATFGIMLAVGIIFSYTQLMLVFPPIPIKGMHITIATLLYAVFVTFQGQELQFAHFGGIFAGFLMIFLWKKKAASQS